MLTIKPAPYERMKELAALHGVEALFCCEVADGSQPLGHVLFSPRADTLEFAAADCPAPILDGLLRAALAAGELSGLTHFRFPDAFWAAHPALEALGYPHTGEIAAFFAAGCQGKEW